jgi:hypothetical protein
MPRPSRAASAAIATTVAALGGLVSGQSAADAALRVTVDYSNPPAIAFAWPAQTGASG